MPTSNELSPRQLREAIKLSEQIQSLRQRLQTILGGKGSPSAPAAKTPRAMRPAGKKRTMSPEGRERIAAAHRARWAKLKGTPAKPAGGKKPTTAK